MVNSISLKEGEEAARFPNADLDRLFAVSLDDVSALDDHARTKMADYLERPFINWSGKQVGVIRATLGS